MKFIEAIKTSGIGRKALVVGGVALAAVAVGYVGKKSYDAHNSEVFDEVAAAEESSVEETQE